MKSSMFNKEYVFRGKHAEMVLRLTKNLSESVPKSVMPTNYSVYEVAPFIGFLFNRTAPLDKSSDADTKIFKDLMMEKAESLKYNYRLLMMLVDKEKLNIEERTRIAFKLDYEDDARAEYDQLYDSYVRGGVEVLYEKVFGDDKDIKGESEEKRVERYLINMYSFVEDFHNRYYAKLSSEEMF